ncbi:HD-GYP domain-containing protein [Allorhizobium taibaishanense]|uniref:HD-GYP domain-containing protein (C-di-GMP phosphodiesterase class II) n=1 Tax=Allorhizobium taibaishanense TaxID=887144 RepID=A0A1Q9A441_9HYPH|nr:HD domain-containing protein [Allorhizobium taibaishanense]MBB4006364.1 HD-GYP domain-containing protein (c-di-GMP phosphodiesterase class II) [Allorhizobium taibaishanense]OLP49316.1 metal-dependent phosphohydrolase [Allorhizobium taibaishanense]
MPSRIRLAEIIEALSYALDMTEGQPAGHCIRCCHIGTTVGRALGLSEQSLHDLYYALMLKDLGCSSNAARICELYLGDDIAFKRDFKLVDGSFRQVIQFLLSHTGMQTGLAERLRVLLGVMKNGSKHAVEMIQTRCQRGADIARQMRFSEDVALGIRDLDEHFDGGGLPMRIAGADIHMFARIALLAQVADVFFKAGGSEAAVREVESRSGTWFDPAIVKAFAGISVNPAFWAELSSPDLERIVLGAEPGRHAIMADEDYLDDIAAAFARVIDAKSPYTSGHSDRVALFTDLIAEQMGLDDMQRRRLKRAALLHDIGKLGVSNSVLDKPAKLDEAEWAAMRRHAELSENILSRIAAFADLAVIGGAHHERLDGRGYPRGLKGDAINLETRIVSTADVFDALTADRPYRAAMTVRNALDILWEGAGTSHDAACIEALQQALAKAELLAA